MLKTDEIGGILLLNIDKTDIQCIKQATYGSLNITEIVQRYYNNGKRTFYCRGSDYGQWNEETVIDKKPMLSITYAASSGPVTLNSFETITIPTILIA